MLRPHNVAESSQASAQRFVTPDAGTMLGDYETLCNAMAERPLVILRRSNKTPVLAMCENCSLKFFTPRELARPVEAEKYLQQKFNSHECKSRVEPIRKG
jgi:hypothetical protein